MSDLKKRVTEQQAIRHQLLANGYAPLPNNCKIPIIPAWQVAQIDAEAVDSWGRSLAGVSTGIRLDGNLIAIDVDVDDADMVEKIYAAVVEAAPGVGQALVRFGGGAKELWFCRLADGEEEVRRIGSTGHVMPGEDPNAEDAPIKMHRVEIWGAGTPRQIGAFGPHSIDDKTGEVLREYKWLDDDSPLNVPPAELPKVTKAQLLAAAVAAGAAMEVAGWPRVRKVKSGENAPTTLYDLTDDMVFHCLDGATRTLQEMHGYAKSSRNPRCSASWLEGPGAQRRDRCLVSLTHDDKLRILETSNYETHMAAEAKPESTSDLLERLHERLLEKGYDIRAEHPDAPDAFEEAVLQLHALYAFDPSRQRQCLPIYDEEDKSCSVGNLRLQYAPFAYEKEGPRGGVKKVNPVDVWINSPERIDDVRGYRFAPDRPQGLTEWPDGRYINSYKPIDHGPGEAELEALWEEFIDHIVPHAEERAWFKDWLAYKMQNPGRPGPAILHYSPVQGTGRGTLFDILQAVFGRRYTAPITSGQLLGGNSQSQYTDWLAERLLITVDEVLQDGDDAGSMTWRRKKDYERLKDFLDPRPRMMKIVRKGLPNYEDQIAASFLMATNHDNALPISEGDRRLVVLRGPRKPLDISFGSLGHRLFENKIGSNFSPVFAATVWWWGQARDVSAFNPIAAPDWGGKRHMVEANQNELDVLAEDMLAAWPCDWADRAVFADRFAREAERKGLLVGVRRNPRDIAGDLLRQLWPVRPEVRPNIGKGSRRTVHCPTDEALRDLLASPMQQRVEELALQEQMDSRANAEKIAERLGLKIVEGG